MISLIYFILSCTSLAQITDLKRNELDLAKELKEVSQLIKALKSSTQNSYILSLQTELNSLKDEMAKIGSSLESLEKSSIDATQDHQVLDFSKVDDGIKTIEKLNENIAVLEARMIILDDRNITQKMDDSMELVDNYDREIRSTTYRVKEQLEEMEAIIKKDKRHYWIYGFVGAMTLAVLISWCIVKEAEHPEQKTE
ncbi:unnamed protein product [Blepharisma stoltei]|uniref:Uncharacterized protein n=1 Tax=Blepharisma stoltei TaxID=1481888 RepID=A0AAU9IZZ1_9CILI|nr:unnamed protein product [Blepharisma stoltei]